MDHEEEQHATDAEEDSDDGQSHKDGSCPEGRRGDRLKRVQSPFADHFLAVLDQPAELPESEMSGALAMLGVTKPVGLQEDHHVDDGEANGEDSPENPDGLGVPQVVGVKVLLVLLVGQRQNGRFAETTAEIVGLRIHALFGDTHGDDDVLFTLC